MYLIFIQKGELFYVKSANTRCIVVVHIEVHFPLGAPVAHWVKCWPADLAVPVRASHETRSLSRK